MALEPPYPLPLSLDLVQFVLYCTTSQASPISLVSSLTAQNIDSYWTSPSGDFAIGFQQIREGDDLDF